MKKTAAKWSSNFVNGLILAFLLTTLALGLLYKRLGLDKPGGDSDPAALVAAARKALDEVSKRDLSATMTPPKYDSILMPLDQLLRDAKAKIEGADYDPQGDFEYIRVRMEPIPEIADAAHRQALAEKTFLRKNYRFMEQKGDACRYLAAATWNRLEARHAEERTGTPFAPAPAEADQLLRILRNGIDASPENKFLWYLSALAERTGGGFAAAQEHLEKALELDPNFIAGWNDLGLTFINLKEFDKAEFALTKARDIAEEADRAAGVPPGGECLNALMNLADFHDALASHYSRESRVNPGGDAEKEYRRHAAAAESCAALIRQYTPYDPPSERMMKGE